MQTDQRCRISWASPGGFVSCKSRVIGTPQHKDQQTFTSMWWMMILNCGMVRNVCRQYVVVVVVVCPT
jgi:hypothetical protein